MTDRERAEEVFSLAKLESTGWIAYNREPYNNIIDKYNPEMPAGYRLQVLHNPSSDANVPFSIVLQHEYSIEQETFDFTHVEEKAPHKIEEEEVVDDHFDSEEN